MALKCTGTVILEDSFFIYPVTSVNCNLILTENVLFCENKTKGKSDVEKIFLCDLVGCHVFRTKTGKWKNETNDSSAYMCIYSYPLKTINGILSRQLRRDRRTITFQMKKYETEDENYEVVKKWHCAINCLLRRVPCVLNGEVSIPELIPSTPKFLILINPKSGSGKAYQIFKERVIPLLVESDIQYELLVTDRANCARDYMKIADLSQWDSIVVVSGDGLLFEVYNGLMRRSDWQKAVKMPVGVIPGGSGNGLARAISHATNEPYDVTVVTPSVLNVIRGRVVPMDLVRVETSKECLYSFLSIGWGLMADIDIESERLRVLGEARFTVWGVIRAIGLRKYKGKLSYLPVKGYQPNSPNKFSAESRPKRSKTIDCQMAGSGEGALNGNKDQGPIFKSKIFGAYDEEIDKENIDNVHLLKFSRSYDSDEFHDPLPPVNSLDTPELEFKDLPHRHCLENSSGDSELSAEGGKGYAKYCPPLDKPVPDDWIVVEDEFVMAYACHQTHLSTDVHFAPEARMDDGIMWLIVIRGGVSRAQVMYFLSLLQSGDHVNVPYVDAIPIHAFRLEPFNSDGHMTIDGELIPSCSLQAEVMPSIARVLTR